jgi:hypothetical protein
VAWLLSLDNDDYLVFYRTDSETSLARHQESISVALEHATYQDIPGGSLPIDGPVGYVNGAEMVGIAAMCARKVSRTPGQPDARMASRRPTTARPMASAAAAFRTSSRACLSACCDDEALVAADRQPQKVAHTISASRPVLL